jgi:hypothetical protein
MSLIFTYIILFNIFIFVQTKGMELTTKYFSFKTTKFDKKTKSSQNDSVNKSYSPSTIQFSETLSDILKENKYGTGLDTMLYFFNNVSEINSLITYIAQKCADIPVRHVRYTSNGKEKDLGRTDFIKLLEKPNHLQHGRTFIINAISSYLVYGFIPINKIVPIGWDNPTELFMFNGNDFYLIPERSINMYGLPPSGDDWRTNKIIKYRWFNDAKQYDFDPSQIILINDSNLSFKNGAYLKGQSRLYSAIRSVKTLSYIYDTVNALIANKGAEGIVTKKSRAGEIDTGWDPEDQKRIEDKLYSYGTTDGRRPIGVSSKDLGFLRLSVPVSEFMPIELKQHEFRTLATALLFPSVLLNDKEGSIYNNVALAQKAFYTDCLMPINNLYYSCLSSGFGLNNNSEALKPDYSEVECLQADKKLLTEIEKLSDETIRARFDNNEITLNEKLIAQSLQPVENGNYLKRDLGEEQITLSEKIGTNGTQSMQSIITDTTMSNNQKKWALIYLFGLDETQANNLTQNDSQIENNGGKENVTE